MNNLGIKATIYDIIGYIVPGFLSIITIFMIMRGGILTEKGEINFATFESNIKEFSFIFYITIFTLSYIAGHIIESISSLIFKKMLYKLVMRKCMKKHYDKVNLIAQNKFNNNFIDCEQNLMSYCEVNYPIINDTAFRFLSFYGFSRNITIILLIMIVSLFLKGQLLTPLGYSIIISIPAMIWNYFRFRKYFELKIISVLLLQDDIKLQTKA